MLFYQMLTSTLKKNRKAIEELFLKGDVTSNEVILSKILFKEFYEVEIKSNFVEQRTYLILMIIF